MGRIVVNNFITIDGFYDGVSGTLDEVFAHRWSGYTSIDEFDIYILSLLDSCETLVLGKNTFLGSKAYWSLIDEKSDVSEIRKRLARRFREIQKIVVGSSIQQSDLDGWGKSGFLNRTDYIDHFSTEKSKQVPDTLVLMSRLMWNEMLGHRLIDELHLTVFPMAIGVGRSIFSSQPKCAFRLKESRSFPDSGNVLLVYDVVYE